MDLTPGRYRHFKGGEYTVIGVARHSETDEWMVVYRPEYGDSAKGDSAKRDLARGDRGLWVRPLSMFTETVEHAGKTVPRFELLLAD